MVDFQWSIANGGGAFRGFPLLRGVPRSGGVCRLVPQAAGIDITRPEFTVNF
jgi:hypothetical protein